MNDNDFDLDFEYDPYSEFEEYDEDLAAITDQDQHDWSFYDSLSVSDY